MSSLRYTFRCLRDIRPARESQWPLAAARLAYRPKEISRTITTTTSRFALLDTNEITKEPPPGAMVGEIQQAGIEKAVYARPLPVSPSYFSRTPEFNDAFVVVQDLARKYWNLPLLPKDQVEPVAWRTKAQFRMAVGEHVKGRDFAHCMKLVKRLNQIHPDLMPDDVKAGMAPFKRDINFYLNRPKFLPVDRFGRSHGVGKRKESVARAWVVEGTGEVLVNGKPLSDAFGRVHDRESAIWGLKLTDRIDKYNVWALVHGGGTTGQAEALALAISKALVVHEPALKNPLRRAGCITRDARAVERKKHGHVKARKMPTWVKR